MNSLRLPDAQGDQLSEALGIVLILTVGHRDFFCCKPLKYIWDLHLVNYNSLVTEQQMSQLVQDSVYLKEWIGTLPKENVIALLTTDTYGCDRSIESVWDNMNTALLPMGDKASEGLDIEVKPVEL
jgi:hypothetical protein